MYRERCLLMSCLPALALQGHFQVVFSRKHCPLFQWRLGFFMRVRPQLYSNMHDPVLQLLGRQRSAAASTVAGRQTPVCMHRQLQPSNLACVLTLLPVCAQILFCSGVWSYLVASIATPTFILVRSTPL
jgi:hypothetical protein